jgi:hypothetical protein
MIIDQQKTQREFIAENLDKQSEKSIDQLQKAWSDQQKLHDLNIPETKRRNRSKIDRVITDEQREALDEEYYGFFRGSVGMSSLWKTFNENNERQKASLEDGNKSAWIPWRTLQLYVSQQSTNQLMRDAKEPARTLAVIPTKSTMVPFKNMQIDSIVLRSNRDGRHAYIVNLVDSYNIRGNVQLCSIRNYNSINGQLCGPSKRSLIQLETNTAPMLYHQAHKYNVTMDQNIVQESPKPKKIRTTRVTEIRTNLRRESKLMSPISK